VLLNQFLRLALDFLCNSCLSNILLFVDELTLDFERERLIPQDVSKDVVSVCYHAVTVVCYSVEGLFVEFVLELCFTHHSLGLANLTFFNVSSPEHSDLIHKKRQTPAPHFHS